MSDFFTEDEILKLKEREKLKIEEGTMKAKKGGASLYPLIFLVVFALALGLLFAVWGDTPSSAATRQPGDSVRTGPFGSQTRQSPTAPSLIIIETAPPLAPAATPDYAATGTAAIEAFASLFPATWTPQATTTPQPTATPQPTVTAVPTATPQPTATPMPTIAGPLVVVATTAPVTAVPLPSPNPTSQAYSDLIADMVRRQNEARLYTMLAGGAILLSLLMIIVGVMMSARGRSPGLSAELQALMAAVLAMLVNGQQPTAPPPLSLPTGPPKRDPAWVQRGNTSRRVPDEPTLQDVLDAIRLLEPDPTPPPKSNVPAPVINVTPPVTPPVTPETSGANAPAPEAITVQVAPDEPVQVDEALMRELCTIWNGLERPSLNGVILAKWGSKNTVRLAITKRALKWGRRRGEVKPRRVGES